MRPRRWGTPRPYLGPTASSETVITRSIIGGAPRNSSPSPAGRVAAASTNRRAGAAGRVDEASTNRRVGAAGRVAATSGNR